MNINSKIPTIVTAVVAAAIINIRKSKYSVRIATLFFMYNS